jgi:hypothetical protein
MRGCNYDVDEVGGAAAVARKPEFYSHYEAKNKE